MSLYHEAAAALTAPASDGGNLKSRIFGPRSGGSNSKQSGSGGGGGIGKKSSPPPAQIYALAIEACKWSPVLSEVIDRAGLLVHERRHRLSPVLALLLVHDLLLGSSGVQLPPGHGLRAAVERHKARLAAELTRARLRRRAPTVAALRAEVERDAAAAAAAGGSLAAVTRWVRINTLRTTLAAQLATTFAGWRRVASVAALWERPSDEDKEAAATAATAPPFYIDEHVPNLVAVPLAPTARSAANASATVDLARSAAYQSGALIFQDKASCFPAYLLFDPAAGAGLADGGDLVDACAAPGNKTSHLAALAGETEPPVVARQIFAFEKDPFRAQTLKAMLHVAGAFDRVVVGAAQDFLRVDPTADRYSRVRALLLDPSCSGSGIVGRDAMPPLVLPQAAVETGAAATEARGKKRKRGGVAAEKEETKTKGKKNAKAKEPENNKEPPPPPPDDAALDPAARLASLASFQLALLLHAFRFPAARRITYSTCSVHAVENEQVVVQALQMQKQEDSGPGKGHWRLLRRDEQVAGMRAWPVRGNAAAAVAVGYVDGDAAAVADACIRSYPDDGRGVMGFFVAAFVRDEAEAEAEAEDGHVDQDGNGDDESEWEGIGD